MTPAGGRRRFIEAVPLLAGAVVAVAALGAIAGAIGTTLNVSDRLVAQLSSRFGAEARSRIGAWQQLARERRSAPLPETALLPLVNAFFNRLPWVSDAAHWAADDYWATPAEALASNGADCEDYSVAKYLLLKELGVPIAKLRITYVTSTRIREPHMVLAYYARPDAEPLLLDNLEATVRPASQRTDLTPVYSFNDDELWLAQGPSRSGGRAASPLQIRKWRDLLEKLEREART
jgi:predicted transglutaminase-like cysteine proteinase